MHTTLRIGMAQIAPIWLNKKATIEKMLETARQAAAQQCELLVFGEALLPGYPFWLTLTHGAAFEDPLQKAIHAHYLSQGVQLEAGDLTPFCSLAKTHAMAMYLGIVERATDRGGHSLYCSLVFIDAEGYIRSVHRKLQPTYEERLTWAPGDGNGLQVHRYKGFSLGGLNCWENWMPLPRAVLYGLGENVHIAVWPGSERNTHDITRFLAKEGRSFVVSVSGLMRRTDFPADTPHLESILANAPEVLADGGSCIAAPDGTWLVPPTVHTEGVITATIHLHQVLEARQNFDVSGHYARPDVTQLHVNRTRQGILSIREDNT